MSFKEYVNEGYSKSSGFTQTEDRIERLVVALDPNNVLCRTISKDADNVKAEFKAMHKHILAIQGLWEDIDYTIEHAE